MNHPQPSSNTHSAAQVEMRRVLQLELQKTRSEASAARLEARAAEIELMIRKIGEPGDEQPAYQRIDPGDRKTPTPSQSAGLDVNAGVHLASPPVTPRFESWEQVRHANHTARSEIDATCVTQQRSPQSADDSNSIDSLPPIEDCPGPLRRVDGAHVDKDHVDKTNVDKNHVDVARPKFLDIVAPDSDAETEAIPSETDTELTNLLTLSTDESKVPGLDSHDQAMVDRAAESWSDQSEDKIAERKRRKPGAWLVSMVAHIAILLVLAAFGIQSQRPKDQIAFTASASESEESVMESFTVETATLEVDPQEVTEESPVEVEYELSPVGAMQVNEMMSGVSPLMESNLAASMTSQAKQASAKPVSMKANSASKMKFCGVEGGGNHFVYLVDSSGSMKEGFESARRALLSSIDLLKPEQRFYVIFFDAKSDFMRITHVGDDESRSVYATRENKAALRRWAMQIRKDRGRAPYDPLRFALQLKPDVIFLLSDGEFPEGIVKLLKEENHVENLFGEVNLISIVHTIGYHSKEGASIMKRIAAQNEGQYRHIPKP